MANLGHVEQTSYDDSQKKVLLDSTLRNKLFDTIQFSGEIYSELNFIGKVKTILKIMNTKGSVIITFDRPRRYSNLCEAEEIYIEKEWDSWELNKDYREIGNSIMDELSNFYELWDSPLNTKKY